MTTDATEHPTAPGARVLAGDPAAAALLERARLEMADLPFVPHLHVVRVGDDPASVSYTRMKTRRARKVGLLSTLHELPAETAEAELIALVTGLNADPAASGILVQLPFPRGSGIEAARVLAVVDPDKDVDGLTVTNTGRLWASEPGLRPCTPAGIVTLLDFYGVPIEGRRAVIVNRSNLVGKPLAALMLARNATVTFAHSRSADLPALTREADILVSAVGRPGFLEPSMVKPGATVVDVSSNLGSDGKLTGDATPEVAAVAGAITPSPGGVGPMTVAHLLHNTVLAARRQLVR